jgi:hypothetical protein
LLAAAIWVPVVQIEARPAELSRRLARGPAAAFNPDAERNQHKAEHEHRGRTRKKTRPTYGFV